MVSPTLKTSSVAKGAAGSGAPLWHRDRVPLLIAVLGGQLLAAILAWLVMTRPLVAVALVYAIGFWIIVWQRPYIALVMIFALAPIQTDIGGGGVRFSLAEIHLGLTLPLLLVRNWAYRKPLVMGPMMLVTGLFLLVCVFSSLQNWRGSVALVSLIQMVLYMVVAVVIFASLAEDEKDFYPALLGLVGFSVLWSVAGIATSFGVLGHNKNAIGGSLACALLVCFELWFAASTQKRKVGLVLAMAVITAGLVLSLSRGAWLGATLGFLFIVCMRRQFKLLLRTMVVMVPLVAVCWNLLPQEDKAYATGFSSERYNIRMRYESVDIARAEYEKNPLYGVGVGLRKEYDATNVQWLTLAETGILGLLAFTLVHLVLLRTVWSSQKKFVRTDPRYSALILGGALILYKLAHGSVDHYWGRGTITIVWAAVGMAMFAYHAGRGRYLEPRQ
jgi:hypothetical protein